MPKKSKVGIRVQYDHAAMSITCAVWNSETEKVLDSETFDFADISQDVDPQLKLYGLSKKLQDANSAVGKDDKREKLAAMRITFDQLCEGKWNAERQGGGVRVVSPEIEAVARFKNVSPAAIQATRKGLADGQWELILANPKIKALIETVKAERASQGEVDLSDLA
jgi:hypothetical protein